MNRTTDARGAGSRRDGAARAPRPAADDRAALYLRQERLLDQGLEETFPASDPVAVMRLT